MAKARGEQPDREAALDAAFVARGGELGWSAFGSGRMDPGEILARSEEGELDDFSVKASVMSVMLDVCLEGWVTRNDGELVGKRALRLARSVRHRLGCGVMLPGVRRRLGGAKGAEVCRRVVDQWLWDGPGEVELGKRVLAIGLFFSHAELKGVSLTQLGKICGESATWMMKRVRNEVNKPIEFAGGCGKATWQHGKEQRRKSAEARVRSHRRSLGKSE